MKQKVLSLAVACLVSVGSVTSASAQFAQSLSLAPTTRASAAGEQSSELAVLGASVFLIALGVLLPFIAVVALVTGDDDDGVSP